MTGRADAVAGEASWPPRRAGLRAAAFRVACRIRGDRHERVLETLREVEGWTPERVRAELDARLARLLEHAWRHVPYYRQPLEASGVVAPGAPPRVDLSRFAELPVLSRRTVRERFRELQDTRPPVRGNPRTVRDSGGTTGDPIRVVRDWRAYEHAIAVQRWFDDWAGYRLGEPRVVLDRSRPAGWGDVRRRAAAWMRGETWLPTGVLSAAVLDAYLDRVEALRPAQVLGMATAVFRLARRAEATGRRLPAPGSVMVTAEPCFPDMRATVRRVFRAPVVDRYGASETGGIASQCRFEGGLHVAAPAVLVEVLRPDGGPCPPGEVGEIVVTPLANAAMPLIRYRIGDLGALEPGPPGCPCRRPLPTLRMVAGRVLDAFVRSDGSLVSGFYVRRFYHRVPWVEQFQVIQVDRRRVHVKLVDGERGAEAARDRRGDLAAVAAHLRRVVGGDCEVTFELCDGIPPEPSGKFRSTLSLVDHGIEEGRR